MEYEYAISNGVINFKVLTHTMYCECYGYLALVVDSCSIINQGHCHLDMSIITCNNESSVTVLILQESRELTLYLPFLVLKARCP